MSLTKRWYASKAVWASLIMLLSIALRAAGIDLGPFEEELTNMILEVVTVGAAVLGRRSAPRGTCRGTANARWETSCCVRQGDFMYASEKT